jgi:hypothetical protein
MDTLIREHQKTAFSNEDMTKFSNCQLLLYEDLAKYGSIDDVLNPAGCAIILYQINKNFGHWIVINKNDDNQIEFFDSYGGKPDSQLKYAKYNKKYNNPYLTMLLLNSPYEVIYNPYKLQSKGFNMNTCGRWCTLRLHMRHIPVCKFAQMFLNQSFKPDWYATALTMFIS